MGLFNLFTKKTTKPYKDEGINNIYELLFCDNIDLFKPATKSLIYPWSILLADKPNIDKLKEITADNILTTRQKILAYNLLLVNDEPVGQKKLLGVIIETSQPQGLDVLAVFNEGTARYINYLEKLLVWETRTEQSDELINNLFLNSIRVVNEFGPWQTKRKPFPTKGMVRLTFLISNGLYFGEGKFEVIQRDPIGGPVIDSAAQLLAYLIQETT